MTSLAKKNGCPGIPFVERCKPMRFGLSVLAKFLVTPETLPLGVYNTLTEKAPWVHGTQADARGTSTMKVIFGCENGHPLFTLKVSKHSKLWCH